MDKNNLVATKKAADILGVSTSTIYRMVEQGLLKPSKTPGGQRRFSIGELEVFKESSKSLEAPQNPSKVKLDDSTPIRKAVDPRNTLNDLNGTEWLPETKSSFFKRTRSEASSCTDRTSTSCSVFFSRCRAFNNIFHKIGSTSFRSIWRYRVNRKGL